MPKKESTVAVVTSLAKPIADELGFQLWDVRFEKEGSSWFLRIIIDKPDGVDMNDCAEFSQAIDPILDEKDPIEQSYYLEVASAGLERELRTPDHFLSSIGKNVQIRTIRPLDGQRDFKGTLTGYQNGTAEVETDSGIRSFLIKECSYFKLDDIDFEIGEIEK